MPNPKPTQVPLDFAPPTGMRWEDLPAPVRARVRAQLAALLRRAATAQEPPDEE